MQREGLGITLAVFCEDLELEGPWKLFGSSSLSSSEEPLELLGSFKGAPYECFMGALQSFL